MNTLTQKEAQALAAWVNEHDDGTPQPRAEVSTTDDTVVVLIRSQDHRADGTCTTATDRAHSYSDARAILGY